MHKIHLGEMLLGVMLISSACSADSQVLGIPPSASSKNVVVENICDPRSRPTQARVYSCPRVVSPQTPKQPRQRSSFGTPAPGPTSVEKTSGIRPPSSGMHRRTVLSPPWRSPEDKTSLDSGARSPNNSRQETAGIPDRQRSESDSSVLQCRTGMFAYMSVTGRASPPNAKPSALKLPSPGPLFTFLSLCPLLHPHFHPPTSVSLFPRTKRCDTLVGVYEIS